MSREFTLHLLQKDLQTQNERWLKLELTGPKVVTPFARGYPRSIVGSLTAVQVGHTNDWHRTGDPRQSGA